MSMLPIIKRVCAQRAIAPSRFGRLAVGDPRLVFDLESGRQLRRKTEQRLIAFLASVAGIEVQPSNDVAPTRTMHTGVAGAALQSIHDRHMMQRGSAKLLAAIVAARSATEA